MQQMNPDKANNRNFESIPGTLSKIFLYVLLIYFPLYELFLHFLQSYTHFSDPLIFWITHFYEPLIVLFLLAYLLKFALERKFPLSKGDIYAGIIIILALLMIAVHRSNLQAGLQGLRFLILPYTAYLIARFSNYKNTHRLIQVYLFIASIMAAMAIVEYFFLPRGYMDIYYNLTGFGFGQNTLPNTTQATAILAGPNQLASYLILPFFYLLYRFFKSKRSIFLILDSYLLIIITLAIGLTYSRSALVGLIVGAILALIYFGRGQRDKVIYCVLFIVVAITLAASYALSNGELPRDLLTHGSSFTQHLQATNGSFKTFISSGIFKIIFGFGVGSAGPVALKLGGIVSENYYLQVCFELGILGLVVYILFMRELLRGLFKGSKTLFFALIALLVNAFFLHIFSDNPAMAVSVFIVIATALGLKESTN